MGGDDGDTSMRGRGRVSRTKLWVLMDARRWHIAAVLLVAVFLTIVVLGTVDPVGIRRAIRASDPVETVFQALLTGTITGVTLVVTINQLVLSQELGDVGDQRERMDGAMSFRNEVEDATGNPVSPTEPAAFVAELVDATRDEADRLRSTTRALEDDRIDDFAGAVIDDSEAASTRLADAEFGTFDVTRAALEFNYSTKLHEARAIQHRRADDLPAGADGSLDALQTLLELFAVSREHIKTLYFQWELINLSRAILYAALPALVTAIAMILFSNDVSTVTGATLGVDHVLLLVAAAATVALTPFVLLLSYILRIATVAKRTLAIGPFVLTRSDEGEA